MGRYVIKIKDQYLEWSTVVDAPVTYGMTLEEFTEYYREEYGRRAMDFEFPERMKLVEEKGTSSRMDNSVEDLVSGYNRAGKNETFITLEEIYQRYCVERTG